MTTTSRALLSAACCSLFACSGLPALPDGGVDLPTAEERDAAERGGRATQANQQLLMLADRFFDFDPTIDPSQSAEQIAAAIQANTSSNLSGCGSASLSGSTVNVFMPAPGCTLKTGLKASGTVSLQVVKSGSSVTVAMTLTGVTVNDTSLAGTASFTTSNGTSFTITANLTSGSSTYSCNVSITSAAGSVTLSGTVSEGQGATATHYTFTSVLMKLGDCYPSSGSVKVVKGLVTTTVTFSSTTPTTGQVSVTVGRKSYPMDLPAYGSCPPGKDGG